MLCVMKKVVSTLGCIYHTATVNSCFCSIIYLRFLSICKQRGVLQTYRSLVKLLLKISNRCFKYQIPFQLLRIKYRIVKRILPLEEIVTNYFRCMVPELFSAEWGTSITILITSSLSPCTRRKSNDSNFTQRLVHYREGNHVRVNLHLLGVSFLKKCFTITHHRGLIFTIRSPGGSCVLKL